MEKPIVFTNAVPVPARRAAGFLLACALFAPSRAGAAGHARIYDFGSVRGNLAPNFSFEQEGQTWSGAAGAVSANPRAPGSGLCAGCRAVTGSFVGRVVGNAPDAAMRRLLLSDRIPLVPGQAYTLSFYYRAPLVQGSVEPRLRFYASPDSTVLFELTGQPFATVAAWTFYSLSFQSPAEAQALDIALAAANATGEGGDLAFDDVVLEEGGAAAYRGQIRETVQLGDGLGRTQEVFTRLAPRLPSGSQLPACLEPFAAYSREFSDIRDRAALLWGKAGSDMQVEGGVESRIYGDIVSGGGVTLRDRASVEGTIRAAGTIAVGNAVEIGGDTASHSPSPACAIPSRTVTPGTQAINVFANQIVDLPPGAYGDVHVYAGGLLKLASGSYACKSFFLEADARLLLTLGGDRLRVGVQGVLSFGDRLAMDFSGPADPFAVEFYTGQAAETRIGPDARFQGVLIAPASEIAVYSRAGVNGAVYGRRVRLEPDAAIGPSQGRSLYDYRVSGTEYDAFSRPVRMPLPVPMRVDSLRFIPGLTDSANLFYQASAGRPEAGGAAFAAMRYAEEPNAREVEASSAGFPWRLGAGHTRGKDFRFAADLSIPQRIEDTSALPAGVLPYTLYWERDADSNFSLTWTDDRSQVVQTAANLTRDGPDARLWKWSIQRHEYYLNGRLRKVYTPLDVAAGADTFALVYNFNAQGLLTSSWSPGKGLMKFWYNMRGQSRFSQDEGQRPRNEYTYTDYDAKGRILGVGVQAIPAMTQAIADADSYAGGTSKTEHIGYIYDDIGSFQARTGFALSEIMPGFSPREPLNRLVCAYNRNSQAAPPGFAARDRFVADFFSYEPGGQMSEMYKYIGPVRAAGQRRQRIAFAYDERDRLSEFTLYKAGASPTVINRENYQYDNLGVLDNLGRVARINGLAGEPIAEIAYDAWGPVRSTVLGGNGAGQTGTRVVYGHHIQGWLKEMRAVQLGTGKVIHQQFLGYESKAHPAAAVPATAAPRFTGQITQQLYKFASDVGNLHPVRLVDYAYDELGRLRAADYRENSNSAPLSQTETIKFPELALAQSESQDSRFDYDLNGRITGQRSAGVTSADSARYVYQNGTYRLDRVLGRLRAGDARNMSNPGNFQYDARGALVGDDSKLLDIAYGWDLMPVRMQMDSGAPAYARIYAFYDAYGQRVSKLETQVASGSEKAVRSQAYLASNSKVFKEWRENYGSSGQVLDSAEIALVHGVYSALGRRINGKSEYFLKNNVGSTMRVVDKDGAYATTGTVLDYLAYGDPRVLKEPAQDRLTERYTGKEYDSPARFHYFGARYFDSELAFWLTPDPKGQFHNPYAYGGNPVKLVDADGDFLVIAIIIGVAIGAYLGGSAANGTFNPLDWDYKKPDTWIGLGVGGLIGGLSGGALAGGAALGTGTLLGGALYGAGIGGGAAYAWAAIGQTQSGQFDVGGLFKAWGVGAAVGAASGAVGVLGGGGNWFTKSLLNSGLEAAKALVNGDDPWKAAAVGFLAGVFINTGGFKLATTGWAGRLAFQGIATAGTSIGRNWVAGRDLFSKVNVGFGPVNFVVGKDATLQDQLSANYYNLALNGLGFANLLAGGDVRWSWSNQTFSYSGGVFNLSSFRGGTGLGVLYGWGGMGNALGSSIASHELMHVWQSRAYGVDQFFALWALSGGDSYSKYNAGNNPGNYFEDQADNGW